MYASRYFESVARIPAICGGTPAFPAGPPPWPVDDPAVLAALQACYADGSWGKYLGPHCDRLRTALQRDLAIEHVRLCSSGSVAVELALRGLGVGAGDEVLLGGYDFPGNFRAITAVGAVPVLVDLDRTTCGIDPTLIAAACSPKTKAVIASHLHGGLVDMPRLFEAAKTHGLAVVEDACQASGAVVYGRPAGTWGDVGTFSFGGSKLLTAGRGGAVVTQRTDVAQRMKVYCEEGNDAFPLSELQAAVLLPQLEKLGERHGRRSKGARTLIEHLGGVDGFSCIARWPEQSELAFYKFGIRYNAPSMRAVERSVFRAAVRAEGIALDTGFRGFTKRGGARCRRSGDLAVSTEFSEQMLLLHHPVLLEPEEEIRRVAETIRDLAEGLRDGKYELAASLEATANDEERF
ncbi:MAG: perosamine synthetase [Pirellula sp.]|nr:perosamine synthetase [Pirellula sp.]